MKPSLLTRSDDDASSRARENGPSGVRRRRASSQRRASLALATSGLRFFRRRSLSFSSLALAPARPFTRERTLSLSRTRCCFAVRASHAHRKQTERLLLTTLSLVFSLLFQSFFCFLPFFFSEAVVASARCLSPSSFPITKRLHPPSCFFLSCSRDARKRDARSALCDDRGVVRGELFLVVVVVVVFFVFFVSKPRPASSCPSPRNSSAPLAPPCAVPPPPPRPSLPRTGPRPRTGP